MRSRSAATIPSVTPADSLTFTTSGSPLTVSGTTPNATAGYSKEMDSSWSQTVTLNSGNNWSAVVKGLEKEDGSGNEYVYYIASVSETGVPTGTSAVIGSGVVYGNGGSGDTLTVTDTLPTTEISAHKDWQGTNPSGHPASVTFHLFADGSEVGSGLVANSGNGWTVSWDTLPYYNDSGNAITYSVTEDAVTDYELSSATYASGTFTLVNTYVPPTGSVQVTKTFVFPANTTLTVPADFQITASWGTAPDDHSVVLKAAGNGYTGALPEGVTVSFEGNGTTAPYTWKLDGLLIGTEVTFRESGGGIAGYNMAVKVTQNGTLFPSRVYGTAASSVEDPLPVTAKVDFENEYIPGVELPATGGPGTAAYTISGLALILGALWMLLRRRRETN